MEDALAKAPPPAPERTLAWFADESCLESDHRYLLDLTARVLRFETLEELATSTSRLALPGVLTHMAVERADVLSVWTTSKCGAVHQAIQEWMGSSLDAFRAFLADESDSVVTRKLRTARDQKDNVVRQVNAAMKEAGLEHRIFLGNEC